MLRGNQLGIVVCIALALILGLVAAESSSANPTLYEPGTDPGVGFNLISWGNFANGASVWQNAVQSIFDAGFDEVSLSPVRFYTPGSGAIVASSSSGPELSHVAAGVARAKQLGMRVTVNPFVEPVGFTSWRGTYNPLPGSAESNTFWNDYQQYIVDVASMAQANGADSMTVGTELKALSRNIGNNANWTSVINAANAVFSGTLGYAANWDNYQNSNVKNTIWEHPAIDFIGIDSYFPNLLNNSQADASGSYPNPSFINQVENAWNNKLDNEILPFAAARKGGTGMPIEFTEVGYLPRNRTSVTPQGESQPVDRDEQNMVYAGLMRALDGRQASGNFLSTHIWNWGMQGTGGNLWDMGLSGSQPHPDNVQTSQWLSTFVNTKGSDPGDPPTGATQILYSFENGLDGFFYPNFEAEPASTLSQATGTGATDGNHSLAITKPTSPWTWDAKVQMTGGQLQVLQDALLDNIDDYLLEIDVTYVASDLPLGLTDLNMHVSIQTNLDGWNQSFPFADIDSPTNQSFQVEIPLSAFNLSSGITSANLHLGFAGQFSGSTKIYIDRIALTDTTFVAPENADFDRDGDVDGTDFLIWQRGFGAGTTPAQGDANGDGAVDSTDLTIWQTQYGALANLTPAMAVPEPASCLLLLFYAGMFLRRKKGV